MDLLIQTLSLERCLLDANGRELILEAAFQVACAEWHYPGRRRPDVAIDCLALGISTGVLELEIMRFQRRIVNKTAVRAQPPAIATA